MHVASFISSIKKSVYCACIEQRTVAKRLDYVISDIFSPNVSLPSSALPLSDETGGAQVSTMIQDLWCERSPHPREKKLYVYVCVVCEHTDKMIHHDGSITGHPHGVRHIF